MENTYNIDLIMDRIPTDSSGKWSSIEDVRRAIEQILQPSWDYYSDLPSPSAYQSIKENAE